MNIDKIILKVLNKQASQEEYETLEQWKLESSDNLDYINNLMLKHSENQIDYSNFDKTTAWKKVSQRIGSNNVSTYVMAASVIIGLVIVLFYYFNQEETYPKLHQVQNNFTTIDLPDQSVIYLNRHTEVSQKSDFSESRIVSLNGEAFFEITPDKEKPFTIELEGEDYIKVVGTSFNLLNDEENFDLNVYSGVVELKTLNRTIVVSKGERISKYKGAYVKLKTEDLNLISWKTKELIFEDAKLDKVFDALQRHYNFELTKDTTLDYGSCSLRSRFKDESLEEVLQELNKIFNLEYRFENNTLEILSLNCN